MEINIEEAVFFRKLISSIKDLSESIEIIFNKKGLYIQEMDSTNACLISVILTDKFFSSFELTIPCVIGVNINSLNQILKIGKTNSNISMAYTENSDKLSINISETGCNTDFEMNLISIEKDSLEIESIDYDYTIYIDTKNFQSIIKNLNNFGDKCVITIDKNTIKFVVSGDIGTGKIELDNLEIECSETCEDFISYAINFKFLAIFAKAGLNDIVTLKMGKGAPFCCEYNLDEDGSISLFIAQMIE